jgi:hypothetical protein
MISSLRTFYMFRPSQNPWYSHQYICFSYGITVHFWTLYCSVLRFLYHTQTHGRTLLDKWSASSKGLYLHRITQHVNTRDKHSCPQRNSNPRYQKPSGRRHTSYIARPPVSAIPVYTAVKPERSQGRPVSCGFSPRRGDWKLFLQHHDRNCSVAKLRLLTDKCRR